MDTLRQVNFEYTEKRRVKLAGPTPLVDFK
jgi:hypothetical protein